MTSSCSVCVFQAVDFQFRVSNTYHMQFVNNTRINMHKSIEFININVAAGMYTGWLSLRFASDYHRNYMRRYDTENYSVLLGLCEGNVPFTRGFPNIS